MVDGACACGQDSTWPSLRSYIFLIFRTRSMPSSPWSSSRPTNGDMYIGSFDPRVAAYTAAACACEKHRVMLTRILFCTDISAARKPLWVHGRPECDRPAGNGQASISGEIFRSDVVLVNARATSVALILATMAGGPALS
jgi:hypothetical protein